MYARDRQAADLAWVCIPRQECRIGIVEIPSVLPSLRTSPFQSGEQYLCYTSYGGPFEQLL
jgi:hypothetical protein